MPARMLVVTRFSWLGERSASTAAPRRGAASLQAGVGRSADAGHLPGLAAARAARTRHASRCSIRRVLGAGSSGAGTVDGLGALSTAAVLDLQLVLCLLLPGSRSMTSPRSARAALAISERLGMGQIRAIALVFLGEIFGLRQQRGEDAACPCAGRLGRPRRPGDRGQRMGWRPGNDGMTLCGQGRCHRRPRPGAILPAVEVAGSRCLCTTGACGPRRGPAPVMSGANW